nr:C10 family peptidase [Dysgonomonas sp. 511]
MLLVILIPYFLPSPLNAKEISVEMAEKVARNYVRTKKQLVKTDSELTLVHTEFNTQGRKSSVSETSEKRAVYYVFSGGDNQGFIIVSADDVAIPVLGYVDSGNYNSGNTPPNFAYWMECLAQEIAYAIENQIKQDTETKTQWENYLSGSITTKGTKAAVAPLVKTKWNQGTPYNNLCPSSSYTGCVATAMAQIMKFYNYPDTRTVTIPGYTTATNEYVIPAITVSTKYDWTNMTNTYSSSSTSTAQKAVSTLMFHCGVSVEMDYTPSSSGAVTKKVGNALCTYFNYDKSVQHRKRCYYSNTEWINTLKAEINAGRPILYSGRNTSSGHAFICDGYDSTDKFYFNWGWGGYRDGYFATTALNPGTEGAGSGAGTYNLEQAILIGIKPNAGGNPVTNMTMRKNTNMTTTKTEVARGEAFRVSTTIINNGFFDFSGDLGIALVDANDNILEVIGLKSISILEPGSGLTSSLSSIPCTIPTTRAAGTYYLRTVTKETNGSSWTIARGTTGYVCKLTITATSKIAPHNMKINATYPFTSSATSVKRGEGFTISPLSFKNVGTTTFSGDLGYALVDDNDNILEIIGVSGTGVSVNAGRSSKRSSIICSVSTKIKAGNYKIRAVAKPTDKEWSIVYGETDAITAILPLQVTSGIVTHGIKIVTGSALTSSATSVERGEIFTVSAKFGNRGSSTFVGDYGVAIVNNSDQILEVIGTSKTGLTLNSGSTWSSAFDATCAISTNISAASYNLRAVVKSIDGVWSIAYGETGVTDILPITVTSGIVADNSNLVFYNRDNPNSFTLSIDPIVQFSPLSVSIGIYNYKGNDGNSPFLGDVELVLCDLEGNDIETIATKKLFITNDGTYGTHAFSSSSITSPGGSYLLRLYQHSLTGERKKVGAIYPKFQNDLQVTVVGTPPHVAAVSPANGATNIPLNGQLVITFDEPMNVNTEIGIVSLGGGVVNTEDKTWATGNTICTIPYTSLDHSTTYTIKISGFQDASGNVMDAVTSGYSFTTIAAPATSTWSPQNGSTDWFNAANWTNGMPGATTIVTIPKSSSYPILSTNATVKNITFGAGAELGRQDLLSYQKAFIEYDFGTGVRDARHRMLSVPLMEVYPGDYSFGSYPTTYFQTFEVNSSGKGYWISTSGGSKGKLTAGTGFVISIGSDNAADKGLGLSGGILRLPFFDSESGVVQKVHPNHSYSSWISTFTNPYGTGSYNVSRTALGYRLAGANVSVNAQFGQNNGKSLTLVGNPFMATIDFTQFYNENSELIKNNYQIWTKVGEQEGYAGYGPIGTWGLEPTTPLSNKIAPLQGFIVEQNTGTGTLYFDLPNIAATGQGGGLLYDIKMGDKLDIVAANGTASVRTFIAKREGGSAEFSFYDARKLMNNATATPEIYTIKPSNGELVTVGANVVDNDNFEYPLGLTTSFAGEITLTFSGMDRYNARIFLVDKVADKKIELTDMDIYKYSFNHTPIQKDGEIIATDNRFVISAVPKGSILAEDANTVTIYSQYGFIHTTVSEPNLIKTVTIYNMQGQTMYQAKVNATTHTTTRRFAQGIYIAQVETENGTETKKLIININD